MLTTALMGCSTSPYETLSVISSILCSYLAFLPPYWKARGAPVKSASCSLGRHVLSAFHVGRRPVVALRDLVVPSPGTILIFNRLGFARYRLLSGCSFGCIPRLIMRWECFRKDVTYFVGPSAVVLYNLIMDIGHSCSPELS